MLREPLRPPTDLPQPPSECISICHPNYAQNKDELLSFQCFDVIVNDGSTTTTRAHGSGTAGSSSRLGVQHLIVHSACVVVSCNRFDGWLSESREYAGALRDQERWPQSVILPSGVYYWHVPRQPEAAMSHVSTPDLGVPYPIVPNFRGWEFPHRQLDRLAGWTQASLPDSVLPSAPQRDITCRITDEDLETHVCHVIPDSELEWWRSNAMSKYNTVGRTSVSLEVAENLLLLRMDLHSAWDKMDFSFVPKQDPAGNEDEWRWALNANRRTPSRLVSMYHNRQLHPLRGVRRELLFARFALHIFPLLRQFLVQGEKRFLKSKQEARWYEADESASFTQGQGQLRSTSSPRRRGTSSRSPSKRQRNADVADDPDEIQDEQNTDGYSEFPRSKRPRTSTADDDLDQRSTSISSDSGLGSFTSKEGRGESEPTEFDNEDAKEEEHRLWLQRQSVWQASFERAANGYSGSEQLKRYSTDADPPRGRKRTRT